MANRYWVGGTGTWDSTNTANWSATSGGAGGASVPTSADRPNFDANSGTGTVTFTNGGVSAGATTINNADITLSLGAAFSSAANLILTAGTFTTNNYNVTVSQITSSNSNVRTINLGSSTVSLNSTLFIEFSTSTNLTFNAGTSQINATTGSPQLRGGGQTFYNFTFTSATLASGTISGANTFNNLTISGRISSGIGKLDFNANQTISGTLSLPPGAGANATCRIMLRSTVLGTQRTLSAAAMSATDVDFQDILITGAAAPLSGTRLGDCKGNSGITFDAAKTVYFRGTGSDNWGSGTNWSATSGGTADSTQFPLAQDTAIIPSDTYPASGSTITMNAGYNLGTVDMSGRTTNTVTLNLSTDFSLVLGNWVNGTGTTISGVFGPTFTGRNTQTITSAGKAFTCPCIVNSPGGSVVLQDALTITRGSQDLTVTGGTFDANGYNVTLTGSFSCTGSDTRTVAIGSGTWIVPTGWSAAVSTNLTVTGTGTISLTSATAKSFLGGNIQTYPTVNQGGVGTLTFQGSNKFAGLTNTAIGRVQFTGGTTNEFGSFVISGVLGNLLQLGSTNTTQAILKKPTAWNMGLLSTDAGNNTGLNFLSNDGTMEYLSVSYINGQLGAANYVVTANNGTYSLTGQNATIAYAGAGGYTLVANNGTYAVTGQAASLLRSRLVSAVYGTYALTGQNATLLKSKVMLANTGAYSVAGQAAIVVYTPAGGAYTIMAGSGMYAVTGQSASLSRDRLISGGVGTYNTTGFAATIQKSRIVYANNGSYTVAGQPAAVVVSGVTPIVPTDDLLIKLRSFTERRRF
jgi:hypothetical protein